MPRTRKPKSSIAVKVRARELRRPQTAAKQLLWERLRGRHLGAKFRRQVPIGPFIVDFYCHEARLVVEVDGETHAEDSQVALDAARTGWLEIRGYRVLRFSNRDVRSDTMAVVDAIGKELPLSRLAGEGRGEGRGCPSLCSGCYSKGEIIPPQLR